MLISEEQMSQGIENKPGCIVMAIVSLLFCGLAFFVASNSYEVIDQTEQGYSFDMQSGEITIIQKKGIYFHKPWLVRVHTVDLKPAQVCIKSESTNAAVNNRVLNCKLVRFNPDGLVEFINLHGRDTYDHASLIQILRIYAYDETREYPFLIVEADMAGTGEGQVKHGSDHIDPERVVTPVPIDSIKSPEGGEIEDEEAGE